MDMQINSAGSADSKSDLKVNQRAIMKNEVKIDIPDRVYFRIGDVADLVGVKPYVLRYWETEFPVINPSKSTTGQRVYRRSDVETLALIKHLLYNERYSIEGARRRIRELRKAGELRAAKKERVEGTQESSAPMSSQKLFQMRKIVRELEAVAQTPSREIFKY